MEPLGDREAVLDGGAYVLREIADLGFVAPEDGAGVENEVFVGEAGVVGKKTLEESGFAGAVAAHEADFFAADEVGGEAVKHLVIAVELGDVPELEDMLAAGAGLVESDIRARDVGAGEVVGLEAVNLFA